MYPFIYKQDEELDDDGDGEISLGMSEKDAFLAEYGAYTEIVYMIAQGDVLKTEEVFKMKAHKFLFWGEYLLKKRKIEDIKK